MIYRFQPFTITKEIGIDYNKHCELVPNPDDWIQIMDYDAMFLNIKQYELIEAAINRYPDTAVFGAMTNRISLREQRLDKNKPDEDDGVRKHMAIAERLVNEHSTGESFNVRMVAGFFMLFRKSYWQAAGGFQQMVRNPRGNFFDYTFCQYAHRNKMPMRVIQGLYMWHSYRLGKDYRDIKHLM